MFIKNHKISESQAIEMAKPTNMDIDRMNEVVVAEITKPKVTMAQAAETKVTMAQAAKPKFAKESKYDPNNSILFKPSTLQFLEIPGMKRDPMDWSGLSWGK